MIQLKDLQWSYCFSYGKDNKIQLDKTNLTQIVGENGRGKSSIALILEEILFNKNSAGIKKADIINRNVDTNYYWTYLKFSKNEDIYEITLKRTNNISLQLLKNSNDISSHTATNTFKTIEDILEIDFKTFSQLVSQNPRNSLQFLTATDTNRKKFLIDLLNLSDYLTYHENLKNLAKSYNSEITSISSKIETINKWLNENELEDYIEKELLEIPELGLEKDREKYADSKNQLDNIKTTNKKIQTNNHYKEELQNISRKLKSFSEASNEIESCDELNNRIGEITQELKSIKTFVEKVKSLDNKCPTCKQEVPEDFKQSIIDNNKETFQSLKTEKEKLTEEAEKKKERNKLVENRRKLENEFQSLYRSIDNNLQESLLKASELEEQVENLSKSIKEKETRVKNIEAENINIEKYNTKLGIIKEQVNDFKNQLDKYSKKLKKIEKEYNNIELLKKAFSTNGLIAYKIESLVKDLENLVNHYLAELSDGRFTLEFKLEKDKLNVKLTDNGYYINITSLSSGELSRVNISTLLAIRKLMNSISKTKINVLFLDEVISVLDQEGKEKLVEVLWEETDLNTFIISHQWSHPLLEKLHVYKDKEVSKIENVSE